MQIVASGPDVPRDSLYEALLYSIFAAKRRVYVVTPYFVPDESLLRSLTVAARRGIDVRVVVPDRSNHGMVDLAGAADLREVAAAGGTVLRFLPRMLHAKAFVVDDVAVVGSANFDVRSFFLDYEVAAFLYSEPEVTTIAAWIESLRDECRRRPASLGPRATRRGRRRPVARAALVIVMAVLTRDDHVTGWRRPVGSSRERARKGRAAPGSSATGTGRPADVSRGSARRGAAISPVRAASHALAPARRPVG